MRIVLLLTLEIAGSLLLATSTSVSEFSTLLSVIAVTVTHTVSTESLNVAELALRVKSSSAFGSGGKKVSDRGSSYH